jgi:hypothetical protein
VLPIIKKGIVRGRSGDIAFIDPHPSKVRKTIVDTVYSLRGVTKGSLIISKRPRKPCVVLGDLFPQWLLHVGELGYNICHVLIRDPIYLKCIHKLCGPTVPVWSGTDFGKFVALWPTNTVDLTCFVDGRDTTQLLHLLSSVGVNRVVSTQTPRHSCMGWHSAFIQVPHSEVGGVTTRSITVVGHSRVPLGPPEGLEPTVKRDATTVLSHSTFGRYFRPQLTELVVDPLRCVNLGSDTSPYYHGYGLLPCRLDRNTRVLTPVLNSATHDGQWGLRPISGEELLLCNDIGALQVHLLLEECLGNAFYYSASSRDSGHYFTGGGV